MKTHWGELLCLLLLLDNTNEPNEGSGWKICVSMQALQAWKAIDSERESKKEICKHTSGTKNYGW